MGGKERDWEVGRQTMRAGSLVLERLWGSGEAGFVDHPGVSQVQSEQYRSRKKGRKASRKDGIKGQFWAFGAGVPGEACIHWVGSGLAVKSQERPLGKARH